MSFNQSKSDRSESSYSRKPDRSGNSSNQRSSYSSGVGVKGGGSTAPPPPSSINATSPILESNVSVARAVQNGAHAQPPLPGVTAKPASSSIPRSPQPIPRPPSKQAAKFGAPRNAIKITHSETHEELRLDKRIDLYSDGSRSHPNVTPQSQPIQSYTPTHQMGYFSHIQPNSYNQTPIFFQAQTTPLTSTQMTANPQPPRYNYSGRTTSATPNLDEQKRDQGSDSSSKDKIKSSNAKVKKKNRKDILKAKQDVKQAIGDDAEKQSKTEQDDWEVAGDGSTPELKTSDNLDEDGSEIIGRNNYSAPLPCPVSSETSWKLQGKGSVSSSKDKTTLEIYKVKSTNARVGKKKRKDILKAADGSTFDLYMAYKGGPEEKQDVVVVSFENIDSSSSVNVKQAIGDDAEKVFSGRNKHIRDFLLTLAELCIDLPESFRVGSDIVDALMIFPIGMPHLIIDNESYPNVGRNMDNRSSAGPRLERRVIGMVDEDKWSKSSGFRPIFVISLWVYFFIFLESVFLCGLLSNHNEVLACYLYIIMTIETS